MYHRSWFTLTLSTSRSRHAVPKSRRFALPSLLLDRNPQLRRAPHLAPLFSHAGSLSAPFTSSARTWRKFASKPMRCTQIKSSKVRSRSIPTVIHLYAADCVKATQIDYLHNLVPPTRSVVLLSLEMTSSDNDQGGNFDSAGKRYVHLTNTLTTFPGAAMLPSSSSLIHPPFARVLAGEEAGVLFTLSSPPPHHRLRIVRRGCRIKRQRAPGCEGKGWKLRVDLGCGRRIERAGEYDEDDESAGQGCWDGKVAQCMRRRSGRGGTGRDEGGVGMGWSPREGTKKGGSGAGTGERAGGGGVAFGGGPVRRQRERRMAGARVRDNALDEAQSTMRRAKEDEMTVLRARGDGYLKEEEDVARWPRDTVECKTWT
ncbi:hypothetical protein R3P38DRAFT_2779730 [Favolaschia claudopus]|uniref:Uncharacterized protein n=1 Tax=Favolaschia claudopus TaxID=2862362 RepID=A0AAW0BAA2_9AGAR